MAGEPSAIVKSVSSKSVKRPKNASPLVRAVSGRTARIVAAVIGMASALAVWLGAFSHDQFVAERQRLASLAPDERTQVRENARKFEALNEEEKRAVRSVAKFVMSKSGADRTRLDVAIREYQKWLQALPISDYDTVLQAATFSDRKAAVEAALARQESAATSNDSRSTAWKRNRSFAVGAAEFPKLTEILENAAGRSPEPERLALLRATEVMVDRIDPGRDPRDNVQAIAEFFDEETTAEILQLRPDPPMPFPLDGPRARSFVAMRIVVDSLTEERSRQIERTRPTAEERKEFFESLPVTDQDEMMDFPASQFENELTMRMMEHRLADQRSTLDRSKLKLFGDIARRMQFMGRLFDDRMRGDRPPGKDGFGGPPRGPGGRGPGRGRDGDSRPERFGEGRPFSGRGPGGGSPFAPRREDGPPPDFERPRGDRPSRRPGNE